MPTLNVKMSNDYLAEIVAYADSKGISKSDAVRHLVSVGLAAEVGGLHYGTIKDAVRDAMQNELTMFKEALLELEDELGDHLEYIKWGQIAALLMMTEKEGGPEVGELDSDDLATSADELSDYLRAAAFLSDKLDKRWLYGTANRS